MDDEKNLDPFGRAQGEDPLTEMGWTGSESTPTSTPNVAPPEAPDHAAGRSHGHENLPGSAHGGAPPPTGPPPTDHRADDRVPQGLRRTRGFPALGCLFPLVVLIFVVSVGAVVVTSVIDAIDEGIDGVVPTVPAPGGGDGGDGPGVPTGLGEGSLLLRGNLAPALEKLQDLTKSRQVRFLRLSAERVDVQVALGGGRSQLAQATYGGEVRTIGDPTPGGGGGTFPWSAVNPSAPRRIATKATNGRSARLDYMVLSNAIDLQWQAFLKNGTHYTASPDGQGVTRVGG